jgi:hypothetical protein
MAEREQARRRPKGLSLAERFLRRAQVAQIQRETD